jgi:hypothetical protein
LLFWLYSEVDAMGVTDEAEMGKRAREREERGEKERERERERERGKAPR